MSRIYSCSAIKARLYALTLGEGKGGRKVARARGSEERTAIFSWRESCLRDTALLGSPRFLAGNSMENRS